MGDVEGPRPRHRPGLDGLRGIAVVAVVAYHLGYLPGGFLGVDVFFVLSGYLITGLILDEAGRDGSVSLAAFWGRRIRRLVPALLAMVVGVLALALALGWPTDERRALGLDATAALTWWGNWRLLAASSYWDSGQSLFRHTWSLAIEEQFYVVWPLIVVAVVFLARRFRLPLAASLGIVAFVGVTASTAWMTVLSSRLADADLTRAYVGTDTRVMAALAGCALAAAVAVRPRWFTGAWIRIAGLLGSMLLVAAFVVIEVTEPALYRRGGFAIVTLAAALAVLAAAEATTSSRDPLGWVTTRAPARYLGLRSYAIYLWSWPIQVLLVFRWPTIDQATLAAITVPVTMVLAEASHHLVEAPLRHRSGWASPARRRRPAWAAGAVASLLIVALTFATSVPRPPQERVETAESAADALRPADEDDAASRPGVDVLIIGDSVAWKAGAYRPLDGQLPRGIASIESRAIIGCGLLATRGWAYRQNTEDGVFALPNKICAAQTDALDLGLEASPDVVLTMPGAWEWADMQRADGTIIEARSDEMAQLISDELVDMIGATERAGARFVLVEWACPGPKSAPVRRDDEFVRWINQTMADAVDRGIQTHGADATFLRATDEICVDADPTGDPTAARAEATEGEFHIASQAGGEWTWDRWLTPAIVR